MSYLYFSKLLNKYIKTKSIKSYFECGSHLQTQSQTQIKILNHNTSHRLVLECFSCLKKTGTLEKISITALISSCLASEEKLKTEAVPGLSDLPLYRDQRRIKIDGPWWLCLLGHTIRVMTDSFLRWFPFLNWESSLQATSSFSGTLVKQVSREQRCMLVIKEG